jgi:membrane protein DedA with SNARE-associated domain
MVADGKSIVFTLFDHLIDQLGYFGVTLLTFLESAFPPIPSEVILPLAGFDAARGKMNIAVVILSGTAGSLAGATLWYFIGRWIGEERLKHFADKHGRLLTLNPSDVDRVNAWFDRHNEMAVLIGRLIMPIRTLISVPAGLFAMRFDRFLIFSSLGIAAWTTLLAGAGYLLGEQYHIILAYLDPVSNIILVGLLLVYIYRVLTWKPH